ncbi:MAG TPA: twin-arginine translocation signal domain-containing protein, partial [Candidatus Tectomicrobia bacterium]
MTGAVTGGEAGLSRREFLVATGGALAGAATSGLLRPAEATTHHPSRGGTLRFAMRSDTTGLDLHRNTQYPVSIPLAAITQGLLDLNLKAEPVPGVASEWEVS